MAGRSLLAAENYVQVPLIWVKIGNYTFGKYEENQAGYKKYPNYVQSLAVTKVNGTVNKYTLRLTYPLTTDSDPNYFEKVFSSISKSRRIEFTYGDAAVSNFLYRNEVALVTSVKSNFNLDGNVAIDYTVDAVSQGALGLGGSYSFLRPSSGKPSDIIRKLLDDPNTGLKDLFPGMRNKTMVAEQGLIPSDDMIVTLDTKTNMSLLAYLDYLVSMMTPDVDISGDKKAFYMLTFVDDTSGAIDGSYFKIVKVDAAISHPEAYEVTVGFPGNNYVFNLNVDNDENFSLLYDYQNQLHPQEYVTRINADGDEEEVYAPVSTSMNPANNTTEQERSWWAKVTQYPIKASIVIKGLLRPALLMSYVRLNIMIYGKKHINSGLYIITKQVDEINGSGYKTTLNMTRIAADSEVL